MIRMNALLDAMEHGAVVVTATQRLSRAILEQFDARQAARGIAVWETPQILPLSAWVRQQYMQNHVGAALLTEVQEYGLWHQVVVSDLRKQGLPVLDVDGLIAQAGEAYQLLWAYGALDGDWRGAHEESQALARWIAAFERELARLKRIAAAQAPLRLIDAIQGQRVELPSQMWWAGFDDLSPSLSVLMQVLTDADCDVLQWHPQDRSAHVRVCACIDDESELRHVAGRIRQIMDHQPRIGILIPNLTTRRRQVLRVLREELSPAHVLLQEESHHETFNFSLGETLEHQPLLRTALDMLALAASDSLDMAQCSDLLLNPYIPGAAEERGIRGVIEAAMRSRNMHRTPWETLSVWHTLQQAPLWCAVMNTLLMQDMNGSHPASYWLEKAQQMLVQTGWPCTALSADEQAQWAAWQEMLQSLAGLDAVHPVMAWHEFLHLLRDTCGGHVLRATPGEQSIQVMGFLEAAGLAFDHLFIIGMDADAWPQTAHPNPLLPAGFQARLNMPHASPEREWMYATQLWEQLLRLAPEIEVSYASLCDGEERQISPLLADFPIEAVLPEAGTSLASLMQRTGSAMQTRPDGWIPVSNDERIHGGAGLLKAQAACPFQAFARYRLGIQALAETQAGLNALERGIFLHTVLDIFWKQVQHRRTLVDLMDHPATLHETWDVAVRKAWRVIQRYVSPATIGLESARVRAISEKYFAIECLRPDFSVRECERKYPLNIEVGKERTLALNIQIDRVDEDAEGHVILLDYKTGNITVSALFGARPDEPQLPLYLRVVDADAVAFAKIRADGCAFTGVSGEAGLLPKIKPWAGKDGQPEDWAALKADWAQVVSQLAVDVCDGHVRVDPKDHGKPCRYCRLQAVCRVDEVMR